ncbi:unnamed protein product, partial [Brenthis ino]
MPYRKKKVFKRKRNQNYDKTGVKSLFSPFTRFTSTRTVNKEKLNVKIHQTNHFDKGLSRKEKSYVISSCQNKLTRYVKLKKLAATAARENKIFSIYGNCNAVRKALLDRGWVEKNPPNRMNLSKIRSGKFSSKSKIQSELESLLLSNLLEKCSPNFIWRTKDQRGNTTIDMTKERNVIINKLEIDAMWTSKHGLCSVLKRNCWFYIENVAEVNGPRSYSTSDCGEIQAFVKDYKITACTSLLKWILSMITSDRQIFSDSGKTPMTVMVFAINRCKEYLYRKQNKDIDCSISSVSPGQWNSFLKKYYSIIAKDEIFLTDKMNKMPLYLSYARYLLKEIHKYRPQLSCEGCHNIWIIKPAFCSRGRGIKIASKLGAIISLLDKSNMKYVIQKYIEEPLLIYETKFDIRQYYLVTSTYPLIIWMYKDCYLKFSSQKYSLRKYDESIHLTNNAIQRKYKNCEGRHSELPIQNMWSLDKYKVYLKNIGKDNVWDEIIYPGMKKTIVGTMLSCQDFLSVSKNRFELYGCDFILDKEYNPWLIEINSCPDLNHTTQVTAKICPAVISDIIKVVIDYANNSSACTGKFERIYQQPITLPRFIASSELAIRGFSLPLDYFYKGNVEVEESYDDINIDKESDIKAALYKIKQFYDGVETMKKTKRNHNVKEKVMDNSHIEELDKVSLEERSPNGTIKENSESFSSSYTISNPIQHVQSVTDIRSLLKKCYVDKPFVFSKLDDGPQGKGSCIKLDSTEKFDTNILLKEMLQVTKISDNHNCKIFPDLRVLQAEATSKIIPFINKKEKEYGMFY